MGDVWYSLKMFSWSGQNGKTSVYLDFIAENMLNSATLVVDIILAISTILLALKGKKRDACVFASVIMGVILYGLVATNIKVAAAISSDEERISKSVEKMANLFGNIGDKVVYQLPQYDLEADVFMENLGLYCGIAENSISQDERSDIMAEYILSYLKNSINDTSDKEFPNSYETNVLMADELYKSFTNLISDSKEPKNISIKNRMYTYALVVLGDAADCRIEADNSLHTAENRRLIGVYYIDAGVCQQNIGECDSAAECYESAAEWAVKSIYSAAIVYDLEAMKSAWNVLDDTATKLETVEQSSDSDNVQKVKNIRDAYKIVINQWE